MRLERWLASWGLWEGVGLVLTFSLSGFSMRISAPLKGLPLDMNRILSTVVTVVGPASTSDTADKTTITKAV